MKTLTLLLLLTFNLSAQCDNDLCLDSETLVEDVFTPFCNIGCQDDFELNIHLENTVGVGNITPCHGLNYDAWYDFTYPLSGSGFLRIDIRNGDCYNPEALENEVYGRFEGWALLLWEGDCENAKIVWSTHCFWLTDQYPATMTTYWGVDPYDPTQQIWTIWLLNAQPWHNYMIQMDGFGWCEGCADIRWRSIPIPLEIDFGETDSVVFQPDTLAPITFDFDVLGRKIR